MSWLFSQALVEEYSGGTSLGGEPSAPSSGNPTQLAYLPPDRMTAFSRPSRSGMTFRPLTDDLGAAVLMWCLEAFPARTSASPAKEPALTASAQACGPTWRASLARFDPATSSWRTVQPSLLEDLGESSVTWPRSGMTAGGQCWELPMSGRRISGTGSGWWPTPTAALSASGGSNCTDKRRPENLASAIKSWPTPTVCGNYNKAGLSPKSGDGLATAVLKWPTPIASDSRGSSGRPAPGKQTQLVDAVRFATPLARDHKSGKFSEDGKAHRGGPDPRQAIERADWWHSESDVGGGPDGLATELDRLAAPWGEGWEDGLPRIATGVQARVDRLKAIGNGQVPLCAATAWQLLTA